MLREKSFKANEYHITKSWALFNRMSIHHIDRRMVAVRLAEIANQNGPVAANRARATLAAFFTWCVRDGLVENNPVTNTNKPGEEKPRQRVLEDHELRAIWNAAGASGTYGKVLRALLLTGARRQEIAGLRWDEITVDEHGAVLILPDIRNKTGQRHVLPLTREVVDIIESMPRTTEYVFGGGKAGFGDHFSKGKLALDARIAEELGAPLEGWVLHDLRRSMRSALTGKLNVPEHIAEAVIGHVRSGVRGVYDVNTYATQKRQALQLWADYVDTVVTGVDRRVVALRPVSA
jgi:integrase